MHCNEAERRLSRTEAVGGSTRDDAELQNHLVSCASCARQAKALELLGRAFADLGAQDTGAIPAWARVKRDIESGATAAHRQPGRIAIAMEKIFNPLSGHTGRRIGFAAAALVLAFVTLIPFHYQRTVGYEVAFAGVDKDLAMDQGKLELLLSKLGLGGATVDLAACEATCSLVVSNLKSKDDCRMLVYAMKGLGDVQVVSDGSPLCEPASGSLMELAGQRVFFVSEGSDPTDVEQRVVECLGADFPEGMNIWVTRCDSMMSVTVQTPDGGLPGEWHTAGTGLCTLMVALGDSVCTAGRTDARCMMICNPDGQSAGAGLDALKSAGIEIMDLKDGLDAETRARLEALGYDVEVSEGEGTRAIKVVKRDEAKATATSDEAGAEAAKGAVVPEGYALDQNYPNPFNPSTTIRFALPQSERVKVEVINMLGQRIRTLVDETMSAGVHELQWDATSDDGKRVPSGTYMYRIAAGEFSSSRTMTLLK